MIDSREVDSVNSEWFEPTDISEVKVEFQSLALLLELLFRGENGVLIPSPRLMQWAANAAIKSMSGDGLMSEEEAKSLLKERLKGVAENSRFGYLLKRVGKESYERINEWMSRQLDGNRSKSGGSNSEGCHATGGESSGSKVAR